MSVLETLRAARKMIENPDDWWDGNPAVRSKPCALVAIGLDSTSSYEARVLFESVVGEEITRFNDSHPHHEVLAAFDMAIERAEGR